MFLFKKKKKKISFSVFFLFIDKLKPDTSWTDCYSPYLTDRLWWEGPQGLRIDCHFKARILSPQNLLNP